MNRQPRGRTHFVRLQELANLELLHASHITHDYPPHIHEQQSIVLMHHGSETTKLRGCTYTALPGSIFVLHPEELHSSKSIDAEYRVFKIQAQEFQRIAEEVLGRPIGPPYFREFIIDDSFAFQSLLSLYIRLEQKESLLQQESEFLNGMAILLSRHNKSNNNLHSTGKEDQTVDMAREYLKAEYRENISLSHLSSLTNLDRFSLLRAFANKVGVPPHEFQTQIRIAHARELIRSGNSITDTALQTGFFDQSHLSRHFKRIVGLTPGQYYSGCNNVQESTTSRHP